jgi:hypothetical protein
MKKFLIAGSSLAAVAAAGSAGAVDVTLGGTIDMGVDFGLGKSSNNLAFSSAFNEVSLSIKAAHTTDGGLMFGGGFSLGTTASIEFDPYADAAGDKFLAKRTVDGRTNIAANLWNVSGGGAVAAAQVVSVKINSSWLGIDKGQTEYSLPLGAFESHNICKFAGRGSIESEAWSSYAGLYTADPSGRYVGVTGKSGVTDAGDLALSSVQGGYLPAGQYFRGLEVSVSANETQDTSSYALFTIGDDNNQLLTSRGAMAFVTNGSGTTSASVSLKATYAGDPSGNTASVVIEAYSKAAVDVDGDGTVDVRSAAVFAGPFMEVMMASSETKMVVGAACLEGNEASKTAFFLNNASKIMTVSDASIYIEGGFGKLTLQTGDYAGGVSSIAGAGDAADIDAGGLVVVAQGVGLFGANPYLAVDLAKGDSLGALEVITGGIIDMGDLYVAVDVALDNPSDVFGVSAWDLGLAYDMGDLSLGFATDSSSDWGLSASMAIAGFGVKTVFGSSSSGDHTKSGITYSVSASTALNGFKLALGFDQDLEPTVGVSYDLGGLVLSAGYDAGDEGGSLGAKLSF